MTVKIALLNEKMGAEELGIMIKAKEAGMNIETVNAKTLLFTQNINTNYDIYINRCKSANRRTKISEFLQSLELPVINTGTVEKISNDKALTSLLLNKYHIPQPKTCFLPYNSLKGDTGPIFRKEEVNLVAKNILNELTFPMVAKPIFGSWGRDVRRIDDEQTLINDIKKNYASISNSGYYIQNLIDKAFDLRSYVLKINGKTKYISGFARVSTSDIIFRSNTHLGGMPVETQLPSSIQKLCCKAADVITQDTPNALLALDLMPIMENSEERDEIYTLREESWEKFQNIWKLRDKLLGNYQLSIQKLLDAEKPLKTAFRDFMCQEPYIKLKKLIGEHVMKKELLINESNASPDFWLNTRYVTGVNLSDLYIQCITASIGGETIGS